MNPPNSILVTTFDFPLLVWGTLHWRSVVRENIRLGASYDEAIQFVNIMLTDRETMPEKIRPAPRSEWRHTVIPTEDIREDD